MYRIALRRKPWHDFKLVGKHWVENKKRLFFLTISQLSLSSSFISTKAINVVKLIKLLCDLPVFIFKLIITTIYSVPIGARHCTRCFTYMLSNSPIWHKFCHLYWKAGNLLIPRSWQDLNSGQSEPQSLALPSTPGGLSLDVLPYCSPPHQQKYHFLCHLHPLSLST